MRDGKQLKWAVVGRMNNNGQSCIASKFIAVEAIADEFKSSRMHYQN
jgi:succinate-semialdehyde dehydrogenase/glutarate-semialdehyde dehydrogenase